MRIFDMIFAFLLTANFVLPIYGFGEIEVEDDAFYEGSDLEELDLKAWVQKVPIHFQPEGQSENEAIKKDIQAVLLEVFKNYPDILKGLIEGDENHYRFLDHEDEVLEHFSITVSDDNEYFEAHDHVAGFCRSTGDKNAIVIKKEHFMSEDPIGLSTLVHEIGHAVYNYYSIHKPERFAILEARLKRAYENSIAKGLWQIQALPGMMGPSITHYARESMHEYWAEGVRIFANHLNPTDAYFINSEQKLLGKEFLQSYDTELYELISKFFNIEASRRPNFLHKNNLKKSSRNGGGYRLRSASEAQKRGHRSSANYPDRISHKGLSIISSQEPYPTKARQQQLARQSRRGKMTSLPEAQAHKDNDFSAKYLDDELALQASPEDFSEYDRFFELLENEFSADEEGAQRGESVRTRNNNFINLLNKSEFIQNRMTRKALLYYLMKHPEKKNLLAVILAELSWSERLLLWLSQLGSFGKWLAELLFLGGSD